MIKRDLEAALADPKRAEWFETWKREARQATEAYAQALARGEKPRFKETVWTELKQWMFDHVFFKKCAYCEGKVKPQSHGHAEHWRPKGAVTMRRDGRIVTIESTSGKHPGYWWLAYEWTNLLPACERCNSGRGKNSQFPVKDRHVFDPTEVADLDELDRRERPLLLNPLRGEDPCLHLRFNDKGQIEPRDGSSLGQHSIEVFDLWREDLNDDRCERIEAAKNSVMLALAQEETVDGLERSLNLWIGMQAPYSAALREHVERRVDEDVAQKKAQLAADVAQKRAQLAAEEAQKEARLTELKARAERFGKRISD